MGNWASMDTENRLDLDRAVASLRADAPDASSLLRVLVEYLAGGLGPRLHVQRTGRLFKKGDEVRSVRIELGENEYESVVDGDILLCGIGHSSGGVPVRQDKVDVNTWLTRLLGSLEAEAARHDGVKTALESLLARGRAA